MDVVLLVVVAHPDDETFGLGSVIAHAAAAGTRVVVCCATRGEAGEDVSGTTTGPDDLGRVRELELRAAANVLGASEVVVLDFPDSGFGGEMPAHALAAIDVEEVVAPLVAIIERVAPDVVVTTDPESVADHRDHARIGEATTIAFGRAAKPSAHLYHWTLARSLIRAWQNALRATGEREAYVELEIGRPDDEITTIVDVTDVIETRRRAITEHRTQASPFSTISPDLERQFLSRDHFVRVVPPWNGGPVEQAILALE